MQGGDEAKTQDGGERKEAHSPLDDEVGSEFAENSFKSALRLVSGRQDTIFLLGCILLMRLEGNHHHCYGSGGHP
jgi:hypothetical protein